MCLKVYYLKVFLAVKNNCLGLHLAVFDVYLVATKHYGNIFTNTYQIPMPVRYVLIRDPGCDIKHDDGTLSFRMT